MLFLISVILIVSVLCSETADHEDKNEKCSAPVVAYSLCGNYST